MDTKTAGITALILIFLCVILEFLYSKMLVISEENFDSCNTCSDGIEKFTEPVGAAEPLYNISQTANAIPVVPTTPTTMKTINELNEMDKVGVMGEAIKMVEASRVTKSEGVHANEMTPLVRTANIPMVRQEVKEEQVVWPAMGATTDFTPFYMVGHDKTMDKEIRRDREERVERETALEESSKSLGSEPAFQVPGKLSERNKPMHYNPLNDSFVINEYDYSDFDHNFLPIARGYVSSAADYGYSYLPPERWYPTPPRNMICVTTKREPILAPLSSGEVAYLKDFNVANKITGPLGLSTEYVNDVLNSNR
jgi:hypothetical protein